MKTITVFRRLSHNVFNVVFFWASRLYPIRKKASPWVTIEYTLFRYLRVLHLNSIDENQ